MAACRHLARDTRGLRQYRPADRTALASAVAAVTMGPVAAWPAQLLPHVPCRDVQPRQPAASHAPTGPLTAEELYIVAAALLADGDESFIHHHGPAQIAGSIQGPQRDAPHQWHATLRGRTRVWDAGGGTPPPGPQLARHAVHAAAPSDDKEAASNILQGRAQRSPWHASYARRPPPQAADHADGDEEAPGATPGTGGAAQPGSIPEGLAPLAPLAPPAPLAPLWAPLGTGSHPMAPAHPDALAAPADRAAMPMRDS